MNTTIKCGDKDFYVAIPWARCIENIDIKNFLICFKNKAEKCDFIKMWKKNQSFEISNYTYSNFKIRNIWRTNVIQCKANKHYNIVHHLTPEDFSNEIPF